MTALVMPARQARRSTARTTAPTKTVQRQEVKVTESVTITRKSESRSHMLKPVEHWGWEEVRDYVVTEIESRFGVFPRDSRKEMGVFKSFCSRHGEAAPIIAQYAFEVCEGWWKGAPISVNRFCKGSDPYFAEVIIQTLSED